MNVRIHSAIILLALLVATTTGLPLYQTYIPNGPNVPDPCLAGNVWSGVGHLVPGGGGDRNPFGLAFAANNHNWTLVCPLDSDGDGRTNGQELGDPQCTWTIGMTSPPATGLTHPGICEPLHSNTCMSKNSWLTCPNQFTCPAINQPGVLSIALRLPPTPVPANGTTYVRYGVFLPNDTDYHIIAFTPIINTSQVLHHMLLFGCVDGFDKFANYSKPQTVGIMPESQCTTMIALWTVGVTGTCLASSYGLLIGTHGFKYALLEFHWNNPTSSASYVDSSGLNIYYTPKLRPYNGGVVMSGQTAISIAPGLNSISFFGGCSSYCSSNLPNTIYLAITFLHMHLLGIAGSVKLYRNGVFNTTLLDATSYSYDSPVTVSFDTPVEFNPGDSIVVNCTYRSTSRNSVVTYGETTSDEMCFAFMSYFPVNKYFETCSKYDTHNDCTNIPETDGSRCSTLASAATQACSVANCSSACQLILQTIQYNGCVTDDHLPGVSSIDRQQVSRLDYFILLCGVSTMPPRSTTASYMVSSTTVKSSATKISMELTMSFVLALGFITELVKRS